MQSIFHIIGNAGFIQFYHLQPAKQPSTAIRSSKILKAGRNDPPPKPPKFPKPNKLPALSPLKTLTALHPEPRRVLPEYTRRP